jgi:hypothetical protein
MYQAIGLYQGKKITVSKQDHGTHWPLHLLILSLSCALLAGILGGLLGVGGGFVMGPLFIELGIAPQVFSSSIDTCDRRCILKVEKHKKGGVELCFRKLKLFGS